MSHLGNSYTSYETFLNGADAFWTTELEALNSSGVEASAIFAINTEEDGTSYLNVAVTATGTTAGQTHAQHIHGLFNDDGSPRDSVAPTIAQDADRDGMVEVLEGLATYGDVLLPLDNTNDEMPTADARGTYTFIQSYELGDDSNFFSPVTGTEYTAEDLMPLALREIVIHGLDVPDEIGAGTEGEVDGGENGFIGILPAAAGELVRVTQEDAQDMLDRQRDAAGERIFFGEGAQSFFGGMGDDLVSGGDGDDSLAGRDGQDTLYGGGGRDALNGGAGSDWIGAGRGDVNQIDAADEGASGSLRLMQYDNGYAGGGGDDLIRGGVGDDIITGDDDSRVAEATGGTFVAASDGSDRIFGGAGNDEIHTGSWADSDNGFANVQTGQMADFASGGSGDDILRGAGGNDTLLGGTGADDIGGGGGNDRLFAGTGEDVVSGDAGADLIVAGGGMDTVDGGTGNDTIFGANGNDLLVGGAGADSIDGGNGEDIIGGGMGNDMLTGGNGMDEFHFDAGTGTDRITDFVQGEDVISLLDGGAIEFANSSENMTRGDSDLSAADFAMIAAAADIDASNANKVLYSSGGRADAMSGTGASVSAYVAATDGSDTALYYDDDWSDVAGRELVATLDGVSTALTVSDFDVY
jgi:Ca2+-binding RTX toxin-like protein